MKKYQTPQTYVITTDLQYALLLSSPRGTHHEGFTESTNPPPRVEDGTDDDSPF